MRKFLVLAFLLFNVSAEAVPALVAHTPIAGSTDATNVTTSSINNTGANLFILFINQLSTCNITPTDTSSNVWVQRSQYANGGGGNTLSLWYVLNPTVTTTQSASASGSNCFPVITFWSFSGANAGFDLEAGSTATATTLQPGSITPGQNNSLLVSGLGIGSASGATTTIDSSYIQPDAFSPYTGGQHFGLAAGYFIQSSAAAINPTWTVSAGAFLAASDLSFKPTVGGGATTTCGGLLHLGTGC